MARQVLKFLATSRGAREMAIELACKAGAEATEKLSGPVNSGTITIEADEKEVVDKAVGLITRDIVLGKLFKK